MTFIWKLVQVLSNVSFGGSTSHNAAAASSQQYAISLQVLTPLLSTPFAKYYSGDFSTFEKKYLFAILENISFGGDSFDGMCQQLSSSSQLLHDGLFSSLTRSRVISSHLFFLPDSPGPLPSLHAIFSELLTEFIQRHFSALRRLRRIKGLDTPISNPAASAQDDKKQPSANTHEAATAEDSVEALLSDNNTTGSSGSIGGHGANSSQPANPLHSFSFAPSSASFDALSGGFSLLAAARKLQRQLLNSFMEQTIRHDVIVQTQHILDVYQQAMHNNPDAKAPFAVSEIQSLEQLQSLLHSCLLPVLPSTPSTNNTASTSVLEQARFKALQKFVQKYGTQDVTISHSDSSNAASSSSGSSSGGTSLQATDNTSTVLFSSVLSLFDGYINALQNFVYSLLFLPISASLSSFASFSMWSEKTSTSIFSNAFALNLPTFSTQPSEYINKIGEYLLTLINQLEPLLEKQKLARLEEKQQPNDGSSSTTSSTSAHSEEEESYIELDPLYWLTQLSRGTFKLLLSSVQSIVYLSEKGSKQVFTDIEYFCSILSALGLNIPLQIQKILQYLAVTQEKDEKSIHELLRSVLQYHQAGIQRSSATESTSSAQNPFPEFHMDDEEDRALFQHIINTRKWNVQVQQYYQSFLQLSQQTHH